MILAPPLLSPNEILQAACAVANALVARDAALRGLAIHLLQRMIADLQRRGRR